MAFAKHSNGRLFRILTGSPVCADIYLGLRVMAAGGTHKDRGGNCLCADGHNKKARHPAPGMPQPFFRNKKSQNPYLQILV